MADKGNRKQGGSEEKRTVLQLAPVKYAITLYYLGQNYVKREDQKYRCKYEFQEYVGNTGNSLETLPRPLPNVVGGNAPDEDSRKAATPQDGLKNPTHDKIYRVLVTDNHTLAESDSVLLGSPNGDNRSRPQYYRLANRKWMRDVIPAAPFRVIVRKYQGPAGSEEQIDLDETLKVLLEIKDPLEEYAIHAGPANGPVKECLKDFFKKYNRTDADPNQGDDNILTHFKGYRKPSDSLPGVRPANVIKRADHIAPPTPETVTADALTVGQLKRPKFSSKKTCWAKFDLTTIQMQDGGKQVKIGMADFAFRPMPIGGDNYRFLLWLTDGSEKDIRDTKINGADVVLLDHARQAIPKPRAYCCGRMVVWRRVDIRLLLTANRLPAGNINWNTVRSYYRHVFTEINGPIQTNTLPLAGWRQSLIDVFNGGNATGDYGNLDNFRPAGSNPGDANYNNIYNQGLFPPFMMPPPAANAKGMGDVMNLCNDILKKAVGALAPVQNPPLTAKKRNIERTGEGIYMLYAKDNTGNLLGFWGGDGKLLVGEHTGVFAAETNETTSHEMAHGFFMRHSHTNTQRRWDATNNRWVSFNVTYTPAAGAGKTIQLVDLRNNCFPEDHDQEYGFKCIMTYLQEEQFCAACALTLRFADRVEIQKRSRFQDRLMKGFFEDANNPANTAKIVQMAWDPAHPNNLTLNETIPNLAHNHTMYLMAVGPERQFRAWAANQEGRANISCAHKTPANLWRSSNTSVLTVRVIDPLCIEVKGKHAGNATVTYSRNGQSVTAAITVT